uniref:Ankyrin repeats (3 copies)/Ankyrin repeat/Ankyrin repeats (Many copies)/Bromodomain, putative n=1 Tax=Theileria annulata TaxID=5874 RepID=A0A3B0MGR0_THEAN
MATFHENYVNNPLVKALMTGTLLELKEVLSSKYEQYKNQEKVESSDSSLNNQDSNQSDSKDANADVKDANVDSKDPNVGIKVVENTIEELVDANTRITPLCQLSHKTNEESLEIAKLLVEDYLLCNPNHVDLIGQTCLFYSARDGRGELCSYFCKKGCDPNHKDRLGQTCIFYAARDGHSEVIKVLVEHGADVNVTDTNSQTCLFYAARDGRVDAVKVLLEKNINHGWKDLQRRTALSFAKSKGHNEIVNLLKKSTPEKQTSTPQKRTLDSEPSGTFEGDPFSGVPMVSGDVFSNKPKRYRLQFRPFAEDDKLWLDAPLIKVQEFELRFPDLAKWDREAAFPPSNTLRNPLLKQWYSLANNLLSTLLKQEGGYVFEKPVDPKKQNCPDYYDIIKKPMSFSCVRGKLRKNTYTDPQQFVDDVLLIFDNCSKYNKPETWVATIGNNLRDFFQNQLLALGFNEFCKKEQLVKQLLDQSSQYLSTQTNTVNTTTTDNSVNATNGVENTNGVDGKLNEHLSNVNSSEPLKTSEPQNTVDVKSETVNEIEF